MVILLSAITHLLGADFAGLALSAAFCKSAVCNIHQQLRKGIAGHIGILDGIAIHILQHALIEEPIPGLIAAVSAPC